MKTPVQKPKPTAEAKLRRLVKALEKEQRDALAIRGMHFDASMGDSDEDFREQEKYYADLASVRVDVFGAILRALS